MSEFENKKFQLWTLKRLDSPKSLMFCETKNGVCRYVMSAQDYEGCFKCFKNGEGFFDRN